MSNKETTPMPKARSRVTTGRAVGASMTNAKDFYDTMLNIKVVAALLKCPVSELKRAALSGGLVNGKSIPAPAMMDDKGHMFFHGQDIKRFLAGKTE
jgi:hypothetical protein